MTELAESGKITEQLSKGPRKTVIIDQQMLLDFEQCDQKKLLSSIKCPVLIIHGNYDEEEKRLSELSRAGMTWLPKDSKLVIVDGAAHSFMDHLDVWKIMQMTGLLNI